MKKRTARILAVCCICAAGAAGSAGAESIFGINHVGERFDTGDARATALGGFVQLLDDSLGVLQYNPATLSWAKRVTFGVAGYVTGNNNKSDQFQERTVATKISGATFAFPIFRRRVTGSFGYRGRYDPDGSFSVPRRTSEGDAYTDRYDRSGSLWTVPFAVAVDLGPRAEIGGHYSMERGAISSRWVTDFSGASTADAVSIEEREFTGHGWGAGAVVRPAERVSLGFTYEAEIEYDSEVIESYTNSNANTSYSDTMTLPDRWTASATVRAPAGITVFAGASVSDFEKFSGLAFPSARLAREEVASLGLEYRPGDSRFPVRTSVRFEQLPYTLPDGENIRKVAFTLGTGLLLRNRTGKLDVALQFGKTGSVDTNTFEDSFVRFFMSVTGSEEWKRKRGSRY